jgi:hypothetical protein
MHRTGGALNSMSALPMPLSTERFAGGNVRGSVVRAHLDWVRDHRDRTEIIEFFELLPPAMRTVVPASWYPFQDLIEVDRVILNRFGSGDLSLLEDVGAYAARRILDGLRRYPRSTSVHEFFRRTALVRTELQDFGAAKYQTVDEAGGRMTHEEEVSCSPIHCATAIGFYRQSIRLHGGAGVQVWESTCQCRGDASCTFELLWT